MCQPTWEVLKHTFPSTLREKNHDFTLSSRSRRGRFNLCWSERLISFVKNLFENAKHRTRLLAQLECCLFVVLTRASPEDKGAIEEIIRIGDVVQVHADKKRIELKLAVVEELNRGADGLVRSAGIRTSNGRTSRPINKLYPLEVFGEYEKIQSGSIQQSRNEANVEVPSTSTVPAKENSTAAFQPVYARPQRQAAQLAKKTIKQQLALIEEEDE